MQVSGEKGGVFSHTTERKKMKIKGRRGFAYNGKKEQDKSKKKLLQHVKHDIHPKQE